MTTWKGVEEASRTKGDSDGGGGGCSGGDGSGGGPSIADPFGCFYLGRQGCGPRMILLLAPLETNFPKFERFSPSPRWTILRPILECFSANIG